MVNDFGLGDSLTGWKLTNPQGLSADGTFVVGYGINPSGKYEGFLASLAPGGPAEPLAGDYNDDHSVDAADYTVWRDNLGSTDPLPNETASLGAVDSEDFDAWRNNFGAVAGSGDGSITESSIGSTVPEPASLMLLALGGLTFTRSRVTRTRSKSQGTQR